MKLVSILCIIFMGFYSQAQNCSHGQNPFAYVVGQVSSTDVIDLDQNQMECVFNVQVHHGNSTIDYNCPIDLYDVEQATYVDPSCSVKVGDQINHSTTQYSNEVDRSSAGFFYWIDLGGYLSQIVFPNYGK
jgi:hypothetical protein